VSSQSQPEPEPEQEVARPVLVSVPLPEIALPPACTLARFSTGSPGNPIRSLAWW